MSRIAVWWMRLRFGVTKLSCKLCSPKTFLNSRQSVSRLQTLRQFWANWHCWSGARWQEKSPPAASSSSQEVGQRWKQSEILVCTYLYTNLTKKIDWTMLYQQSSSSAILAWQLSVPTEVRNLIQQFVWGVLLWNGIWLSTSYWWMDGLKVRLVWCIVCSIFFCRGFHVDVFAYWCICVLCFGWNFGISVSLLTGVDL